HQVKHEWQRYQKGELRGSTIVIVGYGHIGREVGRLCDAFGMRVIVVRKRVTEPSPYAAVVYPPEQLAEALAGADFVVLVSATAADQQPLIGIAELAAMKPAAWLINVGRGALVDDEALIAALRTNQIAGAALDVFRQEPLPAAHPYWDLPNVLLTPHNSASSPWQDQRTIELFIENFRRWLAEEPLLNRVDLQRGY
ncbi:MAG: D-2-hydroxyacid dehydrogenase, partial [Chloroflexota bacterium]|nr:D-2-hydroxyacid dehydrogenase [Chloroflexota bacterium]